MEWTHLAKDIVIPIGSAAVAVLVTVFRLASRFTTLESGYAGLKKQFEDTQKAWKLDLETFEGEIEEQIKELKRELEQTEDRLARFRDSSTDFAKEAELAKFIEEQQRSWKEIQRTLGQIEGALKARR